MSIRLMIVDDQKLLRDALKTLLELESEIEVVSVAANGQEAVEEYCRLRPDVVLMDIRMPVLDGIEATKQILNMDPEAKIVVLTTFDQDDLLRDAIQAGARGYLLKDTSSEELVRALGNVVSGGAAIESSLALRVISRSAAAVPPPQSSEQSAPEDTPLGRRDKEVLELLAKGFSNKEIAQRLFLAEGTVKNRVSEILGKLEVRDRTQAALEARQKGWI